MMMQMLVAGGMDALADSRRTADDDNPRGYFELDAVKRTKSDSAWVDQASGKVVKVVHALLTALPTDRPYRVIFMRRALDEVVRSQDVMLQRNQQPSTALPHDKLVQAFEQQLAAVESYLEKHSCFQVLSVRHEDVLRSPLAAAAAVNRFLGGHLDESSMAAAVTSDLHRQKRPDPSVS